MREDGSVPDARQRSDPGSIAVGLPVFTDEKGYRWIQVGDDQFVALDTQLLRAIVSKWPAATVAEIFGAGVRELTRMVPAR